MKILSLPEGQEWLIQEGKGYVATDAPWPTRATISYPLPVDTGKKTAIARLLASVFARGSQGLFWIKGWGAFPSSENMDLFYGYRKSLGDERMLIDAPFHLFLTGDEEALESLLGMALYFYWDSVLLSAESDVIASTSNDEFIELHGSEDGKLDELTRGFARLGLESQ